MATNPVTTDQLAARWRPLTSAETVVAQSLLDDAWTILQARVPGLAARLDAATLDPELVVAVESAMVLRVLRNPDGKRQESIDDYSWTRDNAVSAGLLYLGDDELTLLSPQATLGGAYVVSLGG